MKLLVILLCSEAVFSARILGVVPTPSYSHQIVFQPLWRELSLRGHQVVTITTDLIKDPSLANLTEIDVSASSYIIWRKTDLARLGKEPLKMFDALLDLFFDVLDDQLRHPQVRNLIENEEEHFDVVIVEGLHMTPVAFSRRFNCPYIFMTTLDAPAHLYYALGNPAHPVLNPDFNLPFFGELNFFQRLASVAYVVFLRLYAEVNIVGRIEEQIKTHFGEGYPSAIELVRNASMMLVTVNPIFHDIKPLLPNIIAIGGGIHLKTTKNISKELELKLDEGEFIYFSLGTNVNVGQLGKKLVDDFMETFAQLPYTVLWKCELSELPGKPKNVIVSKWFPQQDIFKHKNIRLFITQGGRQSMEEAVYHSIPMVGIPVIVDQYANFQKMVAKGVGLSLDFESLDTETLKKTILEVITNPKYRNSIRELASLAKDEPMTGLEKAIWWTEYVIRHKGAKHLRSPAMDLPLYQYFLLDVIAFCLLIVLILIGCLVGLVKLLLKLLKKSKGPTKLKHQ